jgi:hypothetical protein
MYLTHFIQGKDVRPPMLNLRLSGRRVYEEDLVGCGAV